jgi:hypothetical protein
MRFWIGIVALACLCALTACGGPPPVPILGGGPGTPGDPEILRDAIRSVQTLGYQPRGIDAPHGTFYVVSRTDRTGATRFTVQCFREGWVSVVAEGGTIERIGSEIRLTRRMRDEYGRVASAIAAGIEVR